MPALADLVVRRLMDAGVRTLFGVPGGGSSLDLIEAAGRAGLPFVLTATETAAAIAALAQAEITGRPGACLTALGPGASSVVNGVACASLERAPLVVFTDSHPVAAQGEFEHQRLAMKALFHPIAKCSYRLEAGTAVATLDHALKSAMTGRPGPVHVEWPVDVTAIPGLADRVHATAVDTATAIDTATKVDAATAGDVATTVDAKAVSKLETLVAGARKPLVIAGVGARRPEDATAIRSFCERHGFPAMVTYKAKGVVPDDHPVFAGVFTNAAIEQPLLAKSDLLLGLGLDPVELLPRPWSAKAPVVYAGPWSVADDHVPFAVQHIAGVAQAIADLDAIVTARSDWDLSNVAEQVAEQRRRVNVQAPGLTAQRVVQIAAARLDVSRVTVDAGAHMFPATMLWPIREPNGMLISNGLSTMGFALPAAIGAALLARDRPVAAFIGDGGLLMCLGELVTAVREQLRIIVIVVDDGSLSLIEIKQQARRLKPAGLALPPIDWPALAGSLGVAPFLARDEAELERALDSAAECPGPSLIDARIDRSNYSETVRVIRGTI
jgi:acetolactate synthase-1/2/3 large subunit